MTVGAVLTILVGAALLCPVSAPAYDLMKSTNGLIVSRSDDDTRSTDVYLYYDYKGGSDWSNYGGSHNPNYVSSYNQSRRFLQLASTGESVEVPLQAGYRCQMLYLADGVKTETFAVLNEPLDVSGVVTISAMPAVSVDGSVSVDGTMPVSVRSVGSFDFSAISGLLGVAAFLSGGSLVALAKGGAHSAGSR